MSSRISPHPPITRRQFMAIAGTGAAGLVMPSKLFPADASGNRPQQPTVHPIRGKRQLPVVIMWLQGGAPHFDTYDPHPNAPREIKGPYNAIDTNVTGIKLSELLPETARRLNETALLRNIYHRQTDHGNATALALTGHREVEGETLFSRPMYTSAHITLSNYLARNNQMGITIFQANPEREPYGGVQKNEGLYIECEFNGPGHTYDDEGNIYNYNFDMYTKSGRYPSLFGPPITNETRFNSRVQLARSLGSVSPLSSPETNRYQELFDGANSMLRRGLSNAFDLQREDPRVRDRYGRNPLGDAALLTKRMIGAGAKLILINDGFWDLHSDLKPYLDVLVPRLDKAWSALFDDLKDEAVIVVASEFGRTPRMNGSGRDHHPDSNCMLIGGPGIEPQVLGQTNNRGEIIGNDKELDASLLGATILRAAGYELRDGLTNSPINYYPIFTS